MRKLLTIHNPNRRIWWYLYINYPVRAKRYFKVTFLGYLTRYRTIGTLFNTQSFCVMLGNWNRLALTFHCTSFVNSYVDS